MEQWHWRKRLGYGTLQALGLGSIAAAFEIAALTADLRLPMSTGDLLVLGVLDMLLMGLFAAVVAAPAGVAHPLLAARRTSVAVSAQLAVAGAALVALYVAPIALFMVAEGQPVAAVAAGSMPLGFAGVVYLNA